MSPKLYLSMLLCAPYYFFKVIILNHYISTAVKFLSILFLSTTWIILFIQPGNMLVSYMGANFGVMTLVLINVYAHVDNAKSLFGNDAANHHFLFDVIVATGSVSAMLFASYLPQYIYHKYINYSSTACEIGLPNLAIILVLSNILFVVACKNVLMSLPKTSSNYLAKFDLSESHYVAGHYLAMIIFICIFLRNAEFRSTLSMLLVRF